MMVSEMSKQDKYRLFSVILSEKVRGNKHKFKYRKQTCFYYKSGKKLHRLTRQVVKSSSLELSKTPLCQFLRNPA